MKNLRLYWPAWLAAAVVLIATAAVAVYVERSVEATDEVRNRRNAVAIGYDMFTHPIQRAAMERARDALRCGMKKGG